MRPESEDGDGDGTDAVTRHDPGRQARVVSVN
jgi:hypothetical protein